MYEYIISYFWVNVKLIFSYFFTLFIFLPDLVAAFFAAALPLVVYEYDFPFTIGIVTSSSWLS